MWRVSFPVAAAAVVFLFATSVQAETYSFVRITIPGRGEPEDVSGQFFVDVTANGLSQVDFRFRNEVGVASSLTDIYFDDGSLLGIASITDSDGDSGDVSFSQLASPPNLPGGNFLDPPFEVTQGFSADSDPPVLQNGVNAAGEWVTITFDLIAEMTFVDTIEAIENRSLRMGIHVQGIGANEDSDSFISDRLIPEPATALLVALGMTFFTRRGARTRRA